MSGSRPGEARLVDLLAREPRGPRRHVLYAAWLTTRICLDMAGSIPITERNQRRRLQALRKRLGTLTLPVAFRRALHDIIDLLTGGEADAPVFALTALARSVRETLGDQPAAPISAAVRHLRRPGGVALDSDEPEMESG